uniref:Uncharacterized protein n=1 Tax=Lactuca sativa TaxID=4236 RepID=A0A9R1UG09_LACSA|nr:hypothetical protein LSAT_V11C900458140 [Lactuca sativa]
MTLPDSLGHPPTRRVHSLNTLRETLTLLAESQDQLGEFMPCTNSIDLLRSDLLSQTIDLASPSMNVTKIKKEIEDLKNKLSERVDDFDFVYRTKLCDLGERVQSKVRSLISNEWIWNNKFNSCFERFNLEKGKDEAFHGDMMLDEMKGYVKQITEKEIENHAADGIGIIDYAAAGDG